MSWRKGLKIVSLMLALSAMLYGGRWFWKNYPRDYWITVSSGVTHNQVCRFYGWSKGYMSDAPSERDCKKCGGSIRRKMNR